MVQCTEPRQRRPPIQLRVARAPGQHIAFVEQRAAVQRGRGIAGDVQGQVDIPALGQRHHLRRGQPGHRQPRTRRGRIQARQERQQHGAGAVVRGHHPPCPRVLRRVERLRGGHCAFQHGQRFGQRHAQCLGPRRGPHAARPGQQQRIVECGAQPAQLHAYRGLGQVQARSCTGHALLVQQGLQGHQQVQVEPAQGIVHGNAWNH